MTESTPELVDDLETPYTDFSEAVESDGEAEKQEELEIDHQDPDAEVNE